MVEPTIDLARYRASRTRRGQRIGGRIGCTNAPREEASQTRILEASLAGAAEERVRLARELHDTLLQGVTGIALHLRAVLPAVESSQPATAETLLRIAELADRTSREAREAIWDMRSTALREGSLLHAVEAAAHRIAGGTSMALAFVATGGPRRLAERSEAAVLRIVEEAVANIVRHAHARTARVVMAYEEHELAVSVTDDGRGFDTGAVVRGGSGRWGLLGMQERARKAGGSLEVRSMPGHGTEVKLRLPLRQARPMHLGPAGQMRGGLAASAPSLAAA